jgi:hypothetical protein
MQCVKLPGQRLMARNFDRQVAEFQARVAVPNSFTALGIPDTKAAEQVCPGEGDLRPSSHLCNRAPSVGSHISLPRESRLGLTRRIQIEKHRHLTTNVTRGSKSSRHVHPSKTQICKRDSPALSAVITTCDLFIVIFLSFAGHALTPECV